MCEDFIGKCHHMYSTTSSCLQNWWCFCKNKCKPVGHPRLEGDWPRDLKNLKFLELKRGKCRKLQHEVVTAVVWHATHDVLIFCTNSYPETDITVTRKIERNWHSLPMNCCELYKEHGKCWLGNSEEYCQIGQASNKWQKHIFHSVLNVAILNIVILYNKANRLACISHVNRQFQFKIKPDAADLKLWHTLG